MGARLDDFSTQGEDHFADILLDALNAADWQQVQELIDAATVLSDRAPELAQWGSYAHSCIALEIDHDIESAIRELESLRAARTLLSVRLYGSTLINLGIAYDLNEQLDRAERCYLDVSDLYRQQGDDYRLGAALSNLAIVYCKGLDYQSAYETAEQSVAIMRQHPEDERWQYILHSSLNQLGIACFLLGNFKGALAAHEEAMAVSRHLGNIEAEGITWDNIGEVYLLQGRFSEAEHAYRCGRELSEQAGNQRQVALASYSMLKLKVAMDAPENEIEAQVNEALSLAQACHYPEFVTQIILSRADSYDRQGNLDAAIVETQQAIVEAESLRSNLALPEERARLVGSRIEAYEQMVRRLAGRGQPDDLAHAFGYVEMSKSRALAEMLAGRDLHPPAQLSADWLAREKELRRQLSEAYQSVEASPSTVQQLEHELGAVRDRIRLQDIEFASLYQPVTPLSLDEVQRKLTDDDRLLQYFAVGGGVVVFLVSKQSVEYLALPLTLPVANAKGQDANARLWETLQRLARQPGQVLQSEWFLSKFYDWLIAPFAEALRGVKRLWIAPYGALHYVPFHALYHNVDGGRQYLTDLLATDGTIVYTPSATILLDYCQRKPQTIGNGCLAVGFNTGSVPTVALTQAEAEAQAVAHLMGGDCWIGQSATRSALLQDARRYRYVHFSCHGDFNPRWPMASSLTLADGTLDATDVLRDLTLSADLVTLSACKTGQSQIMRGEELIGLTRSFLYAGASAVLVSHWTVDEVSTRLFMECFYTEYIQRGCSLPLALRRAQEFVRHLSVAELRYLLAPNMSTEQVDTLLEAWAQAARYLSLQEAGENARLLAHPYYWATFFLVGERFIPAISTLNKL